MIPCGLISCSKAARKATSSSAGSVMSNCTFGRSVSLFIRGILFSNEFTQGRCADQLGRFHRTSPHRCERIIAHIVDTSYVVAVPGAAEMDGCAADSAVKPPWYDRNGGSVTLCAFVLPSSI